MHLVCGVLAEHVIGVFRQTVYAQAHCAHVGCFTFWIIFLSFRCSYKVVNEMEIVLDSNRVCFSSLGICPMK